MLQFFDTQADLDRLFCNSIESSSINRTVVEISSLCDFYICIIHWSVVSWVESIPASIAIIFYPCMSLAFANHESIDITSWNASHAADGYRDMCKILAYSSALY